MIAIGNHLWHCTLVGVIAVFVTMVLRSFQAKVRFCVWFAASVKFLVPFSLLINVGAHTARSLHPEQKAAIASASPAVRMAQPFGREFTAIPAAQTYTGGREWTIVAIAAIWFSGSLLIAIKRYRDWLVLRSALRTSTESPIAAEIQVRYSPALVEPSVVGWRRPILLLPAGIADTLTDAQLRSVLIHEVFHARRKDNVFASFHMLVEFLFWFHPLVWWIGAQLVTERERACDEEVLRQGTEPRAYAEAILAVCRSYAHSPLIAASGVTGWSMRKRIEEIMADCRCPEFNGLRRAALIVVGVCVLALPVVTGMFNAPVLLAQASQPRFQSVTVRTCSDLPGVKRGSGYISSGGRLQTGCLPLADEQDLGLIQRAYIRFGSSGATNWPAIVPVRGKPSWFASDFYEISGTADPHTPQTTLEGPMLRAALEDRFKLKLHEESVGIQVYELKSDFGGPRLNAFTAGSCVPVPATLPPPQLPNGQRYCMVRVGLQPPAIDAEGVSLDGFAKLLSLVLDRPVMDGTGIAGEVTIHVQFTADSFTPRFFAGGELAPPATAPTPGTATIMRALEQLGLRLEPGNGSRKQLIIDHVEKPAGE